MNTKVLDLMSKNVVTAQPHETVAAVKTKMTKKKLRHIPIVSLDNEPVGVISASDLVSAEKEGTPVSNVMTGDVVTIPDYEDASVAAKMMRNHKIHHLVVTHEKSVIGIISSFDLLKLVEGRRFVMKNPSTPKTKGLGKRAKSEL